MFLVIFFLTILGLVALAIGCTRKGKDLDEPSTPKKTTSTSGTDLDGVSAAAD
jgi:hypothetical protein